MSFITDHLAIAATEKAIERARDLDLSFEKTLPLVKASLADPYLRTASLLAHKLAEDLEPAAIHKALENDARSRNQMEKVQSAKGSSHITAISNALSKVLDSQDESARRDPTFIPTLLRK